MNYTQWTSPSKGVYFPAGDVIKKLPPHYYAIEETMHGICFKQKPLKTQKLLRFPDAASESVIEEIEKFWKLEESFRNKELPYKRGLLLYGPPGSGKTCTLRLTIENLIKEHSGIVVDLNRVHTFKDGYELLRQVHPSVPVIALMEDFESVLYRNESDMLNLLDGMYGIDKVVFLATTNYPEKLGSRIMNRPSRFDKKIFIGMPSSEAREMFIRDKLIDEDDETISRWVEDTNGMSIAHIHELYVANRVLGDSYDEAIGVLKKMVNTPDSKSFDPYRITSVSESKKRDKATLKELMYASFGTGQQYKRAKRIFGNVLSESRMRRTNRNPNSPEGIAKLLSEDISYNNGLVLGNRKLDL